MRDPLNPSPTSSSFSDENEELQRLEHAWERRRRQFLQTEQKTDDLTDDDLHELKGCIELGFGFNEVNGQGLCTTIPALDLYFAVNRQFCCSPVLSPAGSTASLVSSASDPSISALGDRSPSFGSDSDWKICSPGEDPKHVKTKLRHWALAVACGLRQCSLNKLLQ